MVDKSFIRGNKHTAALANQRPHRIIVLSLMIRAPKIQYIMPELYKGFDRHKGNVFINEDFHSLPAYRFEGRHLFFGQSGRVFKAG